MEKHSRKLDSKKILKMAMTYKDRTKTSVYVSAALYRRFHAACEENEANASRAIEILMAEFLEGLPGGSEALSRNRGHS